MRITIDRSTITIAEKPEAAAFIKDWEWIEKSNLDEYARRITEYQDTIRVLNYGNMTVTKNHFHLTIWIDDFIFMTQKHVYVVSGDLVAYFQGDTVDAFIQRYDLAHSYTV